MVKMDRALRVGELFCGAGGFGWGLKLAGFKGVFGIDVDNDACESYRRNLHINALCRRVETVRYAELEPVGGLAFGFPCNDFSMVGERRGIKGYYGGLFREAIRAIDEIKPLWFVAENVPGLMTRGGESILSAFAAAGKGYDLAVHLFRFEDYGVPQRRSRIIAVGIDRSVQRQFRPPVPTHRGHPVTVKDALDGVEAVVTNNELTRHPERTTELLKHIPPGENAWYDGIPQRLRLNVKNCKLSMIYRRLKADEPAYTVVAAGGGGTHMYHHQFPRALTNRERARLQSFPDSFVFVGSTQSVRKQIGMAVPPMGAKAIGVALRKTLSGVPYRSVEPSIEGANAEHPELPLVS